MILKQVAATALASFRQVYSGSAVAYRGGPGPGWAHWYVDLRDDGRASTIEAAAVVLAQAANQAGLCQFATLDIPSHLEGIAVEDGGIRFRILRVCYPGGSVDTPEMMKLRLDCAGLPMSAGAQGDGAGE